MIQYLYSMWSKNNGNFILYCALGIAVAACASWYFDLLPEIELRPASTTSGVETGPTKSNSGSLFVATIIGPENADKALTGFVELYPPYSAIGPESVAILRRPFQLDKDENVTVVVFQEAANGPYNPLVFLDLNANDFLDFDDKNRPAEPVRTLRSPQETPRDLAESEDVLDLTSPAYLTFQFSAASNR